MFVTEEKAAEMYAKACRSLCGARASSVVHSQIKKQQVAGALEGLSTETVEADARRLSSMTSR
jgi:hypothetical protein